MTKRPSVIDEIDMPARPAASSNVVEIPPVAASPAPRPGVHHTSVYIPRAAFERLREMAYYERCKIHDLIMEGLDRVIAERGHPERATHNDTKPSQR